MITDQEHLNNLVVAAYHREIEVYQYQVNIDNYAMMLTALPSGDWPNELAQYRAVNADSLPHDLSDDAVTMVIDYQYRDRLRTLSRTEKAEQSKAARVRDALKTQIGANYDSLIAAYKASQQ
jgi:hypothetical protein